MGRRIVRARGVIVAFALLAAVQACGRGSAPDPEARSTGDPIDLFDPTVVHTVEVEVDQDEYDEMIATFADTGDKESIHATVTIDGVTYDDVGVRLKGNSSLAGLGGGFGGRPGAGSTAESEGDQAEPSDPGAGGRGGPSGGATAEEPEQLPLLIELDEFVDGQSHDGYEDIVIRSSSSETALNEAVALDLLEEAGLPSQEAMAASFTVNGSDPVLRLAIEHPDDDEWYERAFDDAEGALYKAESTGDWSYRGEDPAAYDDVFDQEGGDDVADLAPLTEFLQFINDSDDETFAAELPQRLDVEGFATYLAMMDLIGNFDDIDGPGNNAYLWWDAATEQMTVVPWDMNLAFGGAGGGFGGGGDRQPPEGIEPGELPEGAGPPEGFDPSDLPEGSGPPEGFDPSDLPEGGPGGGPGAGAAGRSNILVERFHADAGFEALYQEALSTLRADLVESGVADDIIDRRVAVLEEGASDLVDARTIGEEAEAIRSSLDA